MRFENVSFGYGAQDTVLSEIDFEVPAGSSHKKARPPKMDNVLFCAVFGGA